MNLYIDNHSFHYEMENLTRAFFPYEKINVLHDCAELSQPYILTKLDSKLSVSVCFSDFSDSSVCDTTDDDSKNELLLAQLLYDLLCRYFDTTLPWGILTGVRPIKLLRRLMDKHGQERALDYFANELRVSQRKCDLALVTEKAQRQILSLSAKDSFSLYISIPFCPSRCNYCSFVSQSIDKAKHLIDDYVTALCKELVYTADIARSLGLRLETVYMGGGTPTTLSASQMNRVLTTVRENFDLSTCREFTVEAGRPDTITKEKLLVIKDNGVDRISINPQTLNDEVLELIGRRHTAKETIDAYNLAVQCGFDNINMDLIAGLTGDTLESFVSTLDRIYELSPSSITIHTLALKRSAFLSQSDNDCLVGIRNVASDMMAYSQDKLLNGGYIPYYLYRQSRMAGNLENIGYSKQGAESLYNVYVMEETHTILACGAGAVTKLRDYSSNHLERIFNHKYPYEYNTRFDELIKRKDRIKEFYGEFFNK